MYFKDNKDFYPTPTEVIEKMLDGVDLLNAKVYEPSAGKGDIIDFCLKAGAKVIASEIDSNLAEIVKSKCHLVCNDFFKVSPRQIAHVDFIIMNPPFSNVEDHILQAYEVAPDGCVIISLLDSKTLDSRNCTADGRRIKYLVKNYGYEKELGNCFDTAERKTSVEVSLIKIYKPIDETDFESKYFDMNEAQEQEQENAIISYNQVDACINSYISAIKHFDQVEKTCKQMNDYLELFKIGSLDFSIYLSGQGNKQTMDRETFKIKLQKSMWDWVFGKLKMNKYMTSKLMEQINKFCEVQKNVPFTKKNIFKMLELIVGTHQERMSKVLIEVFDRLTQHYDENRYHVEGWKTNSHYLVNKKFILPDTVRVCTIHGTPTTRGYYSTERSCTLDDFNKALCHLLGTSMENMQTFEHFLHLNKIEWGKWYYFAFFEVRVYKKGTIHAKFQDDKTWEMFNRKVAELKGYPLPEHI